MSLINFVNSGNAAAEKQQEILEKLKETDLIRFNYPYGFDQSDLLKTLTPISWNGICFPISNITANISHDIAQYRYPNKDGARLESMGRNPIIIKAIAIFCNTINAGPNELWKKGSLYPNVYKEMLTESLLSDTNYLVHPSIGLLVAKMSSFKSNIDATIRGGEIVDIEWIEDVYSFEGYEVKTNIQDIAIFSASAIDIAFANLDPSPYSLGIQKPRNSLTSLLKQINSDIKKTTELLDETRHPFEAFNELERITKDIISSCKTLNLSSNAFVKSHSQNINSYLKILKASNTPVSKYIIKTLISKVPGTLSSFSNLTGNSIDELLILNQILVRKAIISAGTAIKYYEKRKNGR